MTISATGSVVKNLYISHSNSYVKLSNNYFDLIPSHPVKVVLLNKEGLTQLRSGLKFRSYREVYTEGEVSVTVQ
jgi:hypothetical protein